MQPSKANVIIAIPTNGNDGREQLSGVFDYVNMHTNWSIQIINTRTDTVNGILESTLKNADGLLLSISYGVTRLAPATQDCRNKRSPRAAVRKTSALPDVPD